MPGANWFNGSKLNFAENLSRYRGNHIAIISSREDKPDITLIYKELYEFVAACSLGLRKLGVKKGDSVAGFVTNIPETIIAMLAATSIGAIWTSCSPDFGIQGVIDRFGQVKPKILFAIEEYQYNGKSIISREKIESIVQLIPEIEKVVWIPFFQELSTTSIMSIQKLILIKVSHYILMIYY